MTISNTDLKGGTTMAQLNIVYGTWYGDGEELHGNILGVFRDVNTAEDAMIKAARESFDYYETLRSGERQTVPNHRGMRIQNRPLPHPL